MRGRLPSGAAPLREPSGTAAARRGRVPLALPLGLVTGAVALYAVAHPLARRLGDALPEAATVSSAGTAFPGLAEGLGFGLRGLAIVLVAVAATLVTAGIRADGVRWRERRDVLTRVALPLLVMTAAALYGYLGYPHNGFPTNSRIHWVDIYFDRADSFHYTLVKLPHRLFYDAPYLLQAINAAVNVLLAYALGRTLLARRVLALVMAAALVGSSLMSTFADTAEDVQLNVAALLFASLAYARRWTPWLGVSLVLAVMGRPQLVLVWVAVVAAEVLAVPDGQPRSLGHRLRAARSNRFLLVNLGAATALFLAWHTYLVSRDANWFLHDGKLLDAPFTELAAREIDGFVISRFSGAYLLHALWIFPVVYLVATAMVAGSLRRLPLPSRRFAIFSWTVCLGGILASELEPLSYFNVRYLTYLWPFVMVSAWLVLDTPLVKRMGVAAPTVALALSAITPYWQFVDTRERMTRQPVTRAFDDRGELRDLVGGARVATTFELPGVKNYLAYLFKRPIEDIESHVPDDAPERGFVVALSSDGVPGDVVFRDGPLVVIRTG